MPDQVTPTTPPADAISLLAAALARVAELAGDGSGVVPEALDASPPAPRCDRRRRTA